MSVRAAVFSHYLICSSSSSLGIGKSVLPDCGLSWVTHFIVWLSVWRNIGSLAIQRNLAKTDQTANMHLVCSKWGKCPKYICTFSIISAHLSRHILLSNSSLKAIFSTKIYLAFLLFVHKNVHIRIKHLTCWQIQEINILLVTRSR